MIGRPILTRQLIDDHRSRLAQQDVIWSPLFDFNAYATAGQLQLTFFVAPQGSGTTSAPGATGAKTIADTNLKSAGQLTKGNEFYMTGVEVLFFSGASPGSVHTPTTNVGDFVNDNWVVSKSGVNTLFVGSDRKYVEDGPLGQFPPATRLAVASALDGALATGTQGLAEVSYAAFAGEPYSIVPVYFESNQGFSQTFTWPAVVAVSVAGRIGSRLRGYLIRNAQ